MIRQCAWCLILMGEVAPLSDTSITHGMCEECQKEMRRQIEKMKAKDQKRVA